MKLLLVPILFVALNVFSQELLPLRYEYQLANIKQKAKNNNKAGGAPDTLSLPFIDDFSTSGFEVNLNLFQDSSGVFVNNRFCVNPPSYQVATFDGIDFNGQPYSESNQFARGRCDTLTSNPIGLIGKDNVYMSFWWQAQGNAVPQVSTDSIHLLFFDVDSNWNLVWSEMGQVQDEFKQEIIKVDSQYLHGGFKFKFENFGNQSGMFGVWHLDYIYIDNDRSSTDSVINDIAFSNTPSSFLKKYWAMPIWQFFENPAAEVNDSIASSLNNFKFDGTGFDFIVQTNANLIDNLSGSSVEILNNPSFSIAQYEQQKYVSASNSDYSFINSVSEFTTIQNKFSVVSNDQNIGDTINGQIMDFNTTQNDSVSSYTTLADYYAYDDGTAEQLFRLTTQDGMVMQKYEVNRKDTLYGVSVHFPGNVFDYDSNQIVWMVWDSINVGDDYNIDHILHDERGLISIKDSINGFAFYNFLEPVIVEGDFYIGYRQDDDYDILVGYDINSSPGFEPIYFNTSGVWQRFQQNEGVLMIRPHFRSHQFTSVDDEIKELEVGVYPNPTNGVIHFSEYVNQIEVYHLNGRMVLSQNELINSIDISNLDNGMYFLSLRSGSEIKRTKIIKQ